jgi:hypothetical protein
MHLQDANLQHEMRLRPLHVLSIRASSDGAVVHARAGKLPFESAPADDRGLPDMHLARYNDVVLFDQVRCDASSRVASCASLSMVMCVCPHVCELSSPDRCLWFRSHTSTEIL